MYVNYSSNPDLCSPLMVTICGTFFSAAEAKKVESLIADVVYFALDFLFHSVCPANAGYGIQAYTDGDDCLTITAGVACEKLPPPFPLCK